jgi:hypothetical protein
VKIDTLRCANVRLGGLDGVVGSYRVDFHYCFEGVRG